MVVTWEQIFGGTLGFVILVLLAIGLLMVFAGGMSSSPADGRSTTNQGCGCLVVALILIALGTALVLR
jgi:hypothetical protein